MKFPILLLACSLAATSLAATAPGRVGAPSSLTNLSARGLIGATSGSLVAGFVVEGPAAKCVLLRGIGPGLDAFGVSNPAPAVTLNVFSAAGNLIASNRGFQNDPNADIVAQTAARVGAFALSDAGDSATRITLAPGAYTMEIAPTDANAPDGTALLEVYDADPVGGTGRIANLSTRGQVYATAGPLISGFVITGATPKTLPIRGIGPELGAFGIANPAGPVDINVFDANRNMVATNSGYLNHANAAASVQTATLVGAFPLSDAGESAVVVSLAPGAYTIEVTPTASDATDGVGLVELYDADWIFSGGR